MPRKYHVLFEQDENGRWCLEFGAYDRQDVWSEREDRRDHGVKASRLRIVTLPNAKQATVDGAMRAMNSTAAPSPAAWRPSAFRDGSEGP